MLPRGHEQIDLPQCIQLFQLFEFRVNIFQADILILLICYIVARHSNDNFEGRVNIFVKNFLRENELSCTDVFNFFNNCSIYSEKINSKILILIKV